MRLRLLPIVSRIALRLGRTPREFRRHVAFLKGVLASGHELTNVVDIGANRGDWSAAVKFRILKNSKFFLIEPNKEHSTTLRSLGLHLSAVLSKDSRSVKFYSNGGTGDSYYMELTGLYSEQNAQIVQTVRLDQLSEIPARVDLIKIDTQGSEVDILTGFGERLLWCKVVIVEVSIYPYNRGAPYFSEVLEFMKSRGFSAVEILDEHTYCGRLYAVDLAFVNDNQLPANEIQTSDLN